MLKKYFGAGTARALALMALMVTVLFPELALAGTSTTGGGQELDSVFDDLAAYTQGTLGRIITLLFIVAGLGAGIARQSVFAIVTGVGAGLILYNAPTIVNALFTGTF